MKDESFMDYAKRVPIEAKDITGVVRMDVPNWLEAIKRLAAACPEVRKSVELSVTLN